MINKSRQCFQTGDVKNTQPRDKEEGPVAWIMQELTLYVFFQHAHTQGERRTVAHGTGLEGCVIPSNLCMSVGGFCALCHSSDYMWSFISFVAGRPKVKHQTPPPPLSPSKKKKLQRECDGSCVSWLTIAFCLCLSRCSALSNSCFS